LEGYIIDLLDDLSRDTGIDFNVVPVADGKYGSRDEYTGEWNGMIAELRENVSQSLIRCETFCFYCTVCTPKKIRPVYI